MCITAGTPRATDTRSEPVTSRGSSTLMELRSREAGGRTSPDVGRVGNAVPELHAEAKVGHLGGALLDIEGARRHSRDAALIRGADGLLVPRARVHLQ